MQAKPLSAIALMHQDALEANQKSAKTCRPYAWGQQQSIRDWAHLIGHEPTLADWLDTELQRQRYRLIAERERCGDWRRATICTQFRSDSGWASFMVQEGLVDEKERIYALIDTLVRTEELISIRLDDYDGRTGVPRVNHPKRRREPGGPALAHDPVVGQSPGRSTTDTGRSAGIRSSPPSTTCL